MINHSKGKTAQPTAQTQSQPVCTAHTHRMVFTFSGYKKVLCDVKISFIRAQKSIHLKLFMDAFHYNGRMESLTRQINGLQSSKYSVLEGKNWLQACGPSALVTHSPNASCQNLNLRKTAPSSNLVQHPIMSKLLDRSKSSSSLNIRPEHFVNWLGYNEI